MIAERTYEDVVGAYAAQLRMLFVAPEWDAVTVPVTDELPTRAERLADLAEQVGSMTASLLDAPDRAQQLAAETRLLSHAAASAEAARQLLEAAMLGTSQSLVGPAATSGLSLRELADLVEASPSPPAAPGSSNPASPASPPSSSNPPSPASPASPASPPSPASPTPAGPPHPASSPSPTSSSSPASPASPPAPATPTVPSTASPPSGPVPAAPHTAPATSATPAPLPADPKNAKATLADQANRTLQAITERSCTVIHDGMRDLLLLDGATLYRGVTLVSKDAAQLLQQAADTLGALTERLVSAAIRLLLESFNAILALLGGNTQQSRQQVSKWVDQLKTQSQSQRGLDAVNRLVVRIYEPDAVKEDVANWLESTQAAPDAIAQTAVTVQGLSQHYNATANKVEQLLKVIAFVKALPLANTPQGSVVVAAATLGVVGYAVYAGYSHVDSGRIVFANRFGFEIPERIAGVRQTVQTALAGAEPSSPPPA